MKIQAFEAYPKKNLHLLFQVRKGQIDSVSVGHTRLRDRNVVEGKLTERFLCAEGMRFLLCNKYMTH
jgi:hypothetical protein